MPLPTCNPWGDNTVRFSQQQAACRESSARAEQFKLLLPQFLLAVIDANERLAQAGVDGFQPLSEYLACDGEANAKNAQCAVRDITPPFQANDNELMQIILWQLGNGLCAI